jgi:hypothetical protein
MRAIGWYCKHLLLIGAVLHAEPVTYCVAWSITTMCGVSDIYLEIVTGSFLCRAPRNKYFQILSSLLLQPISLRLQCLKFGIVCVSRIIASGCALLTFML